MAYLPVIFTAVQTAPSPTAVQVGVTSSQPLSLKLTHSLVYPVRTPRFVTKYGRTRECGFFLKWVSYDTELQAEPAPSLQHTFSIPARFAPQPGWAAAAVSSHPRPGEPSTPPFPVPGISAPIQHQHLIVDAHTPPVPFLLMPGATYSPTFTNVVLNVGAVPPPPLPSQAIPITVAQMSRATVFMAISGGGPAFLELKLDGLSLGPTNPFTVTYTGGFTQYGATASGPPGSLGSSVIVKLSNAGPNPVQVISAAYGFAELDMENP